MDNVNRLCRVVLVVIVTVCDCAHSRSMTVALALDSFIYNSVLSIVIRLLLLSVMLKCQTNYIGFSFWFRPMWNFSVCFFSVFQRWVALIYRAVSWKFHLFRLNANAIIVAFNSRIMFPHNSHNSANAFS